MSDCCPTTQHDHDHKDNKRIDVILHGSLGIILIALISYIYMPQIGWLGVFTHTIIEMIHIMWWGVALGILFVGLMTKIPKEYFSAVLGQGDKISGLIRATIAGLFLDLCNHGILIVAAKLYERGTSLAQVMAFLIASPWNSLSLSIILIALIGVKWTLIYVFASALVAILTGLIYILLVKGGVFPDNPNKIEMTEDFALIDDAKARLKNFKPTSQFFKDIAIGGMNEASSLLRWLLLSVVIAAAIRAFVPIELFADWFGPTFAGLLATLAVTTIIEVCSEGSAPIASEIFHRAKAPGNGFAFLMAGVSTDYTEIMIIREFSKSWRIALSLPLVTVPQIILLGWIMNMAG